MKYMKLFEEFNSNTSENNYITEFTIKSGSELFHGTSEDFNIKDIRTGSYDGILWTTTDSAISQTYIPVSGSSIYTSTSFFHKPMYNESSRGLQKQLGIEYDYTKVEFDDRRNAVSYTTPSIWEDLRNDSYEWKQAFYKLHKDIKAMKDEYSDIKDEFTKKINDDIDVDMYVEKLKKIKRKILKLEVIYSKKESEFNNKGSSTRIEYDMINDKLSKLGYEPTSRDDYTHNHSWRLKTTFNGIEQQILPANHRTNGRLLIIKPQEDLKIYDLTLGGEVEGDLTDVDYHKIDLFRKVENDGYDGIKINDYAQVESEGNFGHTAIGLFKKTIPKLSIESIDAVHPEDFGNKHLKVRDYRSDEYKAYQNSHKSK